MKDSVKILLAVVIMVAVGFALFYDGKTHQKEIASLKEQLAAAQNMVPLQRESVKIHDQDSMRDVQVITSPVIEAELKALRRQLLIDENLIKDFGLQLKQLDALQKVGSETKDSVKAEYDNSKDVFSYYDRWSDLKFYLQDSTFYYNIRDSLATVVYHEYKHRFLWWRWGIKGYKVKVVNFNPHTTIRYNSYIKPEK
jgi:hypothetical protein